jgi:LPS-assembly lipoprotein
MLTISRRQAFSCVSAWLLTSCGFELQKPLVLTFDRLHFNGFAFDSSMAEALKQALAQNHVEVVASNLPAPVHFNVDTHASEKNVVASTVAGQVREIQLREHLVFNVTDTKQNSLIPSTDLSLTREITYNERHALAKEQEMQASFFAMQQEMAIQVVRRLSFVKL